MSCNQLMSLPDELLELIVSHTDKISKICFAHTCTRLNKLIKIPNQIQYSDLYSYSVGYGYDDTTCILKYINKNVTIVIDSLGLNLNSINSNILHIKEDAPIVYFGMFDNLQTLDLSGSAIENNIQTPNVYRMFKYKENAYNDINNIKTLEVLKVSQVAGVSFKYIKTLYLVNAYIDEFQNIQLPCSFIENSPNLKRIYTNHSLSITNMIDCDIYSIDNDKHNIIVSLTDSQNINIYKIHRTLLLDQHSTVNIYPLNKPITVYAYELKNIFINTIELIDSIHYDNIEIINSNVFYSGISTYTVNILN